LCRAEILSLREASSQVTSTPLRAASPFGPSYGQSVFNIIYTGCKTLQVREVFVRILIIEDEPRVLRTLVKGLEADHFAVDAVTNGDDGLQLATEIDYDAIILDWNLPKIDGLTVLKKLRKTSSPARVIFLSARNEVADRVCALTAGCDDFLVKPFSFEELRVRIHTVLRRPLELLDKLSVADLELDRMRHSVTRAGKLINLTQREYAVLEYLMRNAGRTVTRTMVVEHVWNLGFEGLTNIVDVYINYLRAKIDHGTGRPLIHTVRGVGYCISANDEELAHAASGPPELAASPTRGPQLL
jgi:two-component system copper resistance phosphate regulon response regulator CusR